MGSKKANKNKKNKPNKDSDPSPPAALNSNSHGSGAGMVITDSRFAAVHSDPRFQKVPKHKSKVEIDSRFNRIFTDKSFGSSSAPVDKRGKPKKQNSENFLRHYYRIEEKRSEEEEEETEEEEDEEEERKGQELAKLGGEESETEPSGESGASESEEDDDDDDVENWESDSTDDTDEDEEFHVDYEPEAPEEQVPEIEKETRRLAVVNMDWRYVKAVDLYMMLSSFLPKDGNILSVAVYPSEFGLQRMKEEEIHGPVALFDDESEKNGDDDSDNDDDDDEIDDEKLRAYEKSRLRYYYAVVECDSIATADYLYKACDGVEFERSSNVLDLRFIPDSMEFKHPPRDIATEAPANYEGLNFQTKALQLSKINISWDEDEPDRVKTLKRKFDADQLAELELKEFLASDESESDDIEDEEAQDNKADKKQKKRDMYRALLLSGNGSDEDGDGEEDAKDMEVTFNTGLEDISKRFLKKKDKKQETVWEDKLREQREKKKLRKKRSKHSSDDESSDFDQQSIEDPDDFFVEEEPSVKKHKESEGKSKKRKKQQEDTNGQAEATKDELELLLADDTMGDTGLKGYNLKRKKAKGKDGKKVKQAQEEDKIPPIVDDPRFSSLFTSPAFALDPTDPRFERSSATYARLVSQQKQKAREEYSEREHLAPVERQANADEQVKSDAQPSNKRDELSMLVKLVKTKSKQVKLPSNEKASKKDKSLQSSGLDETKKKKEKEKHEFSTLVQSVKKKTKVLKR